MFQQRMRQDAAQEALVVDDGTMRAALPVRPALPAVVPKLRRLHRFRAGQGGRVPAAWRVAARPAPHVTTIADAATGAIASPCPPRGVSCGADCGPQGAGLRALRRRRSSLTAVAVQYQSYCTSMSAGAATCPRTPRHRGDRARASWRRRAADCALRRLLASIAALAAATASTLLVPFTGHSMTSGKSPAVEQRDRLPSSDRPGRRRSAREQVSGRKTTGASSPLAPCTVMTRTSSRPCSMSRFIS